MLFLACRKAGQSAEISASAVASAVLTPPKLLEQFRFVFPEPIAIRAAPNKPTLICFGNATPYARKAKQRLLRRRVGCPSGIEARAQRGFSTPPVFQHQFILLLGIHQESSSRFCDGNCKRHRSYSEKTLGEGREKSSPICKLTSACFCRAS